MYSPDGQAAAASVVVVAVGEADDGAAGAVIAGPALVAGAVADGEAVQAASSDGPAASRTARWVMGIRVA
ncbi:MAG: hypothetical protein R2742_11240 [Micropruina glycogenica]